MKRIMRPSTEKHKKRQIACTTTQNDSEKWKGLKNLAIAESCRPTMLLGTNLRGGPKRVVLYTKQIVGSRTNVVEWVFLMEKL